MADLAEARPAAAEKRIEQQKMYVMRQLGANKKQKLQKTKLIETKKIRETTKSTQI